jgi:translocation and assembly module TamA
VGDRYSLNRLQDLQRTLTNGPWFASVVVDIERDPAKPLNVPVTVNVVERPTLDVGLALGFSTDTGPRAEVSLRHRNVLDRGFDLQSALRIDAEHQFGYADVYLPPGLMIFPTQGERPFKDSVGVLAEHETVQNLDRRRFAVAGYRNVTLSASELRFGLSYQWEKKKPEGAEDEITRALAPVVAWTWRHVDDPFDPKRGGVLNLQVAAGGKAFASSQDFVKLYAQYTRWLTFTPTDQLVVRGELGRTIAPTREGIPEDFLFRAGGSRSNRGYEYESLGVTQGNAIVGGRYLLTGSADFIHWLSPQWGAAVFYDVGDAADSAADWDANQSYGVGARYKTPAGPLALDLAYAEAPRKFRLSFSVTVAF